MKILLNTGFDAGAYTKEMKKIMDKSTFPDNIKGEIVEYMETHAVELPKHLEYKEFQDYCKQNPENIYRSSERIFHVWNSECSCLSKYTIFDIDTSRPWTVTEYDGAVTPRYLDYDVINADMNYCELRR